MPLDGTYEPSPVKHVREQVELYEKTDGAKGATMQGMPVVILTSIGATSGKLRKIPLMKVEHDGQYVVVASLGGAPQHPLWYHNLVADPRVQLRDGAQVFDGRVRELDGAERELWWERAVAAFPPYAGYAKKTERLIPVFLVEAVELAEVEAELQRIEQSTELDDEIAAFWENARGHAGLAKIPVVGGLTVTEGVAPVAWSFGDNPALADELLGLVLAGTKTGTSSAEAEYGEDEPLPQVGDLSIIVDGGGHPRALIRTTEVEVVPFDEVSEDFAAAEGEDDLSLAAWRTGHERYFRRTLGLDALPEGFAVVTERFELLYP